MFSEYDDIEASMRPSFITTDTKDWFHRSSPDSFRHLLVGDPMVSTEEALTIKSEPVDVIKPFPPPSYEESVTRLITSPTTTSPVDSGPTYVNLEESGTRLNTSTIRSSVLDGGPTYINLETLRVGACNSVLASLSPAGLGSMEQSTPDCLTPASPNNSFEHFDYSPPRTHDSGVGSSSDTLSPPRIDNESSRSPPVHIFDQIVPATPNGYSELESLPRLNPQLQCVNCGAVGYHQFQTDPQTGQILCPVCVHRMFPPSASIAESVPLSGKRKRRSGVSTNALVREKVTAKKDCACSNCGTTITTLWRRSPDGTNVCNPCGLYYKLHKYNRPLAMRKDTVQRRKRKPRASGNRSVENRDIAVLPNIAPSSSLVYAPPLPSYQSAVSHSTYQFLNHQGFLSTAKEEDLISYVNVSYAPVS